MEKISLEEWSKIVANSLKEPQEMPELIVIDYTVDDDWLDDECKECAFINAHNINCRTFMNEWFI